MKLPIFVLKKVWLFVKPSFEVASVFKMLALCFIVYRLFCTNLLASTEHISSKNTANSNFNESCFEGVDSKAPWEYMGNDVTQICSAALEYYEWGVQYNTRGPIIRVTCNTWNYGYRVCTNPEYAQADVEPFVWGGECWIWGTSSTLDDLCPSGYHLYYQQDANGRLNTVGGNGCGSLPAVYRRPY
jgi:hypothetical protein